MGSTDQLLYVTKHDNPRRRKVLWRPGEGSSVVPGPNMYLNFTHISRTVHVFDALDVCVRGRMVSRHVQTLSSINNRVLRGQYNNPCRNIRVLWFGAKTDDEDDDKHDWYGNVEFSLPINIVLQQWKNYYLVEMMTAPTHTATRILVTNKCYDSVLPRYDPKRRGGSWLLTRDTNRVLKDCRRYNSQGSNKHGHTLEFMIEATPYGLGKILEVCTLSFRNHENAVDMNISHVCHRFQFSGEICPVPFTRAMGSRVFFYEHTKMSNLGRPIAKPKLSPSGMHFLQCFLAMQSPPRPPVPTPNHMALAVNPLQPHPNFPFNLLVGQQMRLDMNGLTFKREILRGFNPPNQHFMTMTATIRRQNEDEEENDGGPWGGRRHVGHNNISGQIMPPPPPTRPLFHHSLHPTPPAPSPNFSYPPPNMHQPPEPVEESSPALSATPVPLLHDFSKPPPSFPSPFYNHLSTPQGFSPMMIPDVFQHSWGALGP